MAREIPQYVSQLTSIGSRPQVQFSDAGARSLNNLSAEMRVMGEDIQRKNDEMFALQTETTYKENLNRIYNENKANPSGFNKSYDAFYKEFRSKLPDSEIVKKLDIQHNLFAQSYRDKITEQYSQNVEEDYKTTQLKTLQVNKVMLGGAYKQLAEAKTPEARESAMQQIQLLNEADAEILSSKDYRGSNRYSPEFQVRDLVDRGKIAFTSLPAQKRLEVLGDSEGGFAAAQQLVAKHEGGYNPVDGNTGQPALFGINRKWHPEGYAQVEAIYKSKGTAAGQAAADAYLKKTFWDANGIDSLDPRVQGIVYDGAINHRTDFVKELVSAAKNGASAGTLLEMRQKEYDRLAASGKYSDADVTSWNNRLQDYQHLAVSDYENYVDQDTKEQLLRDARSEVLAEEKMWRDDAPKAALLAGARTPFDIVQSQVQRGVPTQYARVIDDEAAQTMAQRINQSQTTDDVISAAAELQQTYGEFTPNAIQDLKEFGKMKPEMEGALSLAAMNRPEYKQHIDLLALAGRTGSDSVNKAFAANGFNNKDITAKIFEETEDYQRALQFEGKGDQLTEKISVLTSLAKSRMNQTLDDNYGDAAAFAVKPFNDMYALRDVGKGILRIPSGYPADVVSDNLEDIIDKELPKLTEGSRSQDYVYSGNIVPFLSETEDSVKFRAIETAEPVTNKQGEVIEFKLKDIVGKKKVKTFVPRYEGPAV